MPEERLATPQGYLREDLFGQFRELGMRSVKRATSSRDIDCSLKSLFCTFSPTYIAVTLNPVTLRLPTHAALKIEPRDRKSYLPSGYPCDRLVIGDQSAARRTSNIHHSPQCSECGGVVEVPAFHAGDSARASGIE